MQSIGRDGGSGRGNGTNEVGCARKIKLLGGVIASGTATAIGTSAVHQSDRLTTPGYKDLVERPHFDKLILPPVTSSAVNHQRSRHVRQWI